MLILNYEMIMVFCLPVKHFIHSLMVDTVLTFYVHSNRPTSILLFASLTYMNVIIAMMANKHVSQENQNQAETKKVDKYNRNISSVTLVCSIHFHLFGFLNVRETHYGRINTQIA